MVLEPTDLRVEVIDRETSTADVGLGYADVIIAGGAGCDAPSWHLVEELAETFGGRVAASRGAVEAGLAPRALQVGQTGTTVHPLLYVACGISGALQHAVGMRTAAPSSRSTGIPTRSSSAWPTSGSSPTCATRCRN